MDEFIFYADEERVRSLENYLMFLLKMNLTRDGEITVAKSLQSEISTWIACILIVFLVCSFLFGLPLNITTILIFVRRKKLRDLINFVLLLDSLAHILLCILGVPIHITEIIWMTDDAFEKTVSSVALLHFKQLLTNFTNLFGIFLAVSIAILRYRRICWKKKDQLSRKNALKWTFMTGLMAIGFSLVESASSLMDQPLLPVITFYSIKITLVILSVGAVSFCYVQVARKVWSSDVNSQENVTDANKRRKKIRAVHVVFHSAIQIILPLITLSPYLYFETIETFKTDKNTGSSYNPSQGLLAISFNYILVIFGTPLAYIASCHRFREQFISIVSGILGHAPAWLPSLPNLDSDPGLNLQSMGSLFRRLSTKRKKQEHQNKQQNHQQHHQDEDEHQEQEEDKTHTSVLKSHTDTDTDDNNICTPNYNVFRPQKSLALTHNSDKSLTFKDVDIGEKKRYLRRKDNRKKNNQMANLQALQIQNQDRSNNNDNDNHADTDTDNDVTTLIVLMQRERENNKQGENRRKFKVKGMLPAWNKCSVNRQNSILDTLRPLSCIHYTKSSCSVSSSSTSTSTYTSPSNSTFIPVHGEQINTHVLGSSTVLTPYETTTV